MEYHMQWHCLTPIILPLPPSDAARPSSAIKSIFLPTAPPPPSHRRRQSPQQIAHGLGNAGNSNICSGSSDISSSCNGSMSSSGISRQSPQQIVYGFDNTGNLGIWPGELFFAHYALTAAAASCFYSPTTTNATSTTTNNTTTTTTTSNNNTSTNATISTTDDNNTALEAAAASCFYPPATTNATTNTTFTTNATTNTTSTNNNATNTTNSTTDYYYTSHRVQLNDLIMARSSVKVIELGSGHSGLAGLSLLKSDGFDVGHLVLTDGNTTCVKSLQNVARQNSLGLARTRRIEARHLAWLEVSSSDKNEKKEEVPDDLKHAFDLVLACDCFYSSRQSHQGLLDLIDDLLTSSNPDATVLCIAPLRQPSLSSFMDAAISRKWLCQLYGPDELMTDFLLQRVASYSVLDRSELHDKLFSHMLLLRRQPLAPV